MYSILSLSSRPSRSEDSLLKSAPAVWLARSTSRLRISISCRDCVLILLTLSMVHLEGPNRPFSSEACVTWLYLCELRRFRRQLVVVSVSPKLLCFSLCHGRRSDLSSAWKGQVPKSYRLILHNSQALSIWVCSPLALLVVGLPHLILRNGPS